jgi:uncharacterized small protein (TIGR04563 family)
MLSCMSRDNPQSRKSFYFPQDIIEELLKEAKRLDRSPSWLLQHAWKLAKKSIAALPSMNDENVKP